MPLVHRLTETQKDGCNSETVVIIFNLFFGGGGGGGGGGGAGGFQLEAGSMSESKTVPEERQGTPVTACD